MSIGCAVIAGKSTNEHKLAGNILGLDEKQHLWMNDTTQRYLTLPVVLGKNASGGDLLQGLPNGGSALLYGP